MPRVAGAEYADAERNRRLAALARGIVGVVLLILQHEGVYNTRVVFPFFKRLIPDLGYGYLLFAVFVLVAESNAVNLTDGLDGLAISVFAIAAGAYTALAYVTAYLPWMNRATLAPGW